MLKFSYVLVEDIFLTFNLYKIFKINLLGYFENNACGYGLCVHIKLHILSIEGSWKVGLFKNVIVSKKNYKISKFIKVYKIRKDILFWFDTKGIMI
jgi:hypothetical protein